MATEKKPKLKEARPDLLEEWDYEKNKELSTETLTTGSSKSAWWICEKGHSYEMQVKRRVGGSKCPYCMGIRVLAGFNDLESQNPKLAESFDEDKNGVKASEVHATSRKEYWWKCREGHSWQATPESRTRYNGCPYCSGRYATDKTSLAAINPTLADELHPTKNGELTRDNLTSQSNKDVWWICSTCGHEWMATVNNRAKGKGCPACAISKRRTK